MFSRSLVTGACLLALLAGCTTAPQKPTGTTTAKADTVRNRNCPTTGSRAERNQCAPFARYYSGDELRGTGMTDVGHALQMLDPEITASGAH
jgi:hypothetical protein